MDRPMTDEQLDRMLSRYMGERAERIEASAGSGLEAAERARTRMRVGAHLDRRMVTAVLLALLALLAVASIVVVGQAPQRTPAVPVPAERGSFTLLDDWMAEGREQPSATLLPDGRVLVIGGWPMVGPAEIWDPVTRAFSPAGTLVHARWNHTATLLEDGRVLVVGGWGAPGNSGIGMAAEIWDPATRSFTELGSPALDRARGTAELLSDGRVLISGGTAGGAPAEVWDPGTGAFRPAGPELTVRPDGTLLADGRVLVVNDSGSTRIWDPVDARYRPIALPRAASYGVTTTLLADGRLLLVGGDGAPDTAEVWDPVSMTSEPTGSPSYPRARHTAVLLADGRVLVLGDNLHIGYQRTAEVFELR